jgi:hypothetical protein
MSQFGYPSTSQSAVGSSALSTYVGNVLTQAKQNRKRIEPKWLRNFSHASATEDFDSSQWKQKDEIKRKAWKSKSYMDITRQKITAFTSLAQDALFKGGRVPFMLQPERSQYIDPASMDAVVEQTQEVMHSYQKDAGTIAEMCTCLNTAATYGEFVAKRIVIKKTRKRMVELAPGIVDSTDETIPIIAMRARSVWDMWYDRERGGIENSDYVFERSMIRPADIRKMIGLPYYIPAQVKMVMDRVQNAATTTNQTTADTSTLQPGHRSIVSRTNTIELYEGWLNVQRKDADDFEREYGLAQQQELLPPDVAQVDEYGQPVTPLVPVEPAPTQSDVTDTVYAFVVILDGEIVAMKRDPGLHPYFADVFEETIDDVYGRGIADNMESWQKSLNGAVRTFENNAKLIANFILAVKRRLIANKIEDQIEEGGVIELTEDVDDVRKAIQQLQFVDITGPMMQAIKMFLEFSDLASNLPRSEQGQQATNPQTAFELQQRLERSGKYIGQIIRRFDKLIAWDAQNLYDWIVYDPQSQTPMIPAAVKALGFTSFENRYMRVQRLMQMLQMVLSDGTGALAQITKIRWLWEEIGKAQDLETSQYIKTEQELQYEQYQQVMMQQQAAMQAAQQTPESAPAQAEMGQGGMQ